MMSPDVYKEYLTGVIKRTQFMNSLHLFAVFGLTLWIHKCSNNDLKLMNKLLEETKQAKQAAEMFFAAFSHEFRNPLNS
jgi:signal transduction histidine kinase